MAANFLAASHCDALQRQSLRDAAKMVARSLDNARRHLRVIQTRHQRHPTKTVA